MDRLLDLLILFARHPLLALGAVFILWLVLDRWKGWRQAVRGISPTFVRPVTVVLALVVLAGFAAVGGWYLGLDGFAGEVEPLVTSLSWLVGHGEPLYHEFEYSHRYSVLYGPAVFLTNGWFLKALGPSLTTAKLPSFLGALASLGFLFAALARRDGRWLALGVTGLAALYYWTQGFGAYLVRPDAHLLFTTAAAMWAAVRAPRTLAVIILAVMLGVAVNLKIHAVIYFLPVLALALGRFGWRAVAAGLVGAGVVVALPFVLHPQVSAVNYVAWIRNAMDQGLGNGTLPETTQYAFYLLMPLALVLILSPRRSALLRRHALLLGSLPPAFLLILVLAEKPGAGLVHLLPLVPTTLFALGLLLQDLAADPDARPRFDGSGWRHTLGPAAVAGVLAMALLAGTVNAYRAVRLVRWQVAELPGLTQDVRTILGRFPDLTIGMACGGENASFRVTWLHPLLVFAGNPLLVETVAVMDCRLNGLDMPPASFTALEEGLIRLWLVPRGQRPFTKRNWYPPHGPLFSDRFRENFEANYSRSGASEYYDLWWWNGWDLGDPETWRPGGQ